MLWLEKAFNGSQPAESHSSTFALRLTNILGGGRDMMAQDCLADSL